MIIKNVILFLVLVCLSIKIEAKICQYLSSIKVNVTTSYTYTYPVAYYGECDNGKPCLRTRWETRVQTRTIERPDAVIERKCCPGWRDISSNKTRPNNDSDLICVQDSECVGAGPCYNTTSTMKTNQTTHNAIYNATRLLKVFRRKSTTTSERPKYTNNNTVPYHWRNIGGTSTERNNNDNRRYTTSTERYYNHTMPYYTRTPFRYATSTKRNDNETAPYYQKYTTSTERNYNNTVPYHWRHTTSKEIPRDPIVSNDTTDVELSNNAPTSNISTEEKMSGINATEKFINTESNLINNNVTDSTGSLEDNNTTDHDVPFINTTSSVATMEKEKPITPMWPQLRWILISSCIILTYIALCLTVLVLRVILLNKKPNEENTFG